MGSVKLYRKRIIPAECIFLRDDEILYQDREVIITRWHTLRPKKTLHHGYSCYFLDRGFKVSKFYDHEGQLISWYCDIISYTHTHESRARNLQVKSSSLPSSDGANSSPLPSSDEANSSPLPSSDEANNSPLPSSDEASQAEVDTFVFTDLLVDVIIYPDGAVRVVDLDEMADALRDGKMSAQELQAALRHLDKLLSIIYAGHFSRLQQYINERETQDTAWAYVETEPLK